MAEIQTFYYEELKKNGKTGFVELHEDLNLLFIDEDPDRAWAELGQYFLKETQQYTQWQRAGVSRPLASSTASIDELRRQKIYEILTPDECLGRARGVTGRPYKPILHPLAGGIPIDRAWRSMELFADKVLSNCGNH